MLDSEAEQTRNCKMCGGDGWYVIDDGYGQAMQEQCEACQGEGKVRLK
jgi:DnaJ-class molecular chaperone